MPVIDRRFLPDKLGKVRKGSSKILVFAMVLVAVLMLGAIAGLMVHIGANKGQPTSKTTARIPAGILYITHSPIFINGNTNFTTANGVSGGTGTASDPYIIADWDINASTANGIWINATDVHFIIRNCYVHSTLYSYNGINLLNCVNGNVEDNTCSNGNFGIILYSSTHNMLTNNNFSSNFDGIELILSNNNTLNGNSCNLTTFEGIELFSSSDNTLSNNNCGWDGSDGIDVYSSSLASSNNNTLIGNNCSSNTGYGIGLSSSNDTVSNNTCNSNGMSGLYIFGGNFNAIASNRGFRNTQDGIDVVYSSNNAIVSNDWSSNGYDGASVEHSTNNTLDSNNCSSDSDGIYLDSSSYNTLNNNNCSSSSDGISLYLSSNNTLINNNCSSTNSMGIDLWWSNNNTLSNNDCSSNGYCGMYLYLSNSSALINNNCSSNGFGMILSSSSNSTVDDNNCSSNGYDGILISSTYLGPSSNDNEVVRNQVCNNARYGVNVLSWSKNNRICNNTFIGNNGATGTYSSSDVQACDNGTNNWWNSTDGYGNYWSDWTTPDANHDGIVDVPYNIGGSAGAKDYYPLTTVQTRIPEFGMMPFVVIGLMAVIVVAEETRRRNKSRS